jgi:hypothetical protein
MKQLVHDDYSYLDKIEWSENIHTISVSFNLLTGDRIGQRIDIPVRVKEGNIWDALIENKLFVDNDELKAKVIHRTNKAVKDRITRRVTNYKKGVDIYNALTELVVKDKRKNGYSDGRYDGKVLHTEVSKTQYEDYLSENEFSFRLDCEYDYNWDNDTYESRYIYKNSYAHESVTTEFCNIDIKFEIMSLDLETKMYYKIPHFTLDLLYTDTKNQEGKIDLISNSCFDSVWKKGKRQQKMTFQSYRVCETSRYVNLNTFMIYVRETSQTNKDTFKRESERKTKKEKVQQDIIDKYPDANVFVEEFYKSKVTHNYSANWGRYGMKCICVEFKDKSFVLYSVSDATRGEEKVVGVFDSEYQKPKAEQLIESLTKRNK